MDLKDLPADNESPETKIIPTEDINTVQHKISGEKFPEIILELCDFCHWSHMFQQTWCGRKMP